MKKGETSTLKLIDSILAKCTAASLTLVCLLCVATPLLVLIAVLYLYRVLIIYYAKASRGPKSLEELDLTSSALAGMDDIFNNPFNVMAGAAVLEGIPDIEVLRSTVGDQLLGKKDPETGKTYFPQLFQLLKYIGGIPFWDRAARLPKQRVLEECVKLYTPAEGEGPCNRSRLLEISKEFAIKPFSKGLPLWEIIVIPNYVPHPVQDPDLDVEKSYFGFLVRVHHSLCDGVSMLWLTQYLSLNSHTESMPLFARIKEPGRKKTQTSFLSHVWKCIQGLHELISEILLFLELTFDSPLWPADPPVSPGSGKPEGASRLSVAQPASVNISDVGAVKRANRVSGMGVIILSMMRAVRKTLLRDMDPVPSYSVLMMALPIPRGDGQLKNRYTFCSLSVPTFIEDAKVHLQEIDKVFSQLKVSMQPHINAVLMNLFGIPPRKIVRYLYEGLCFVTDFVGFSSVMGPTKLKDLSGYPLKRFAVSGSIPIGKKFPLLYFTTMGGGTNFGGVADKMVIPSDSMADELALKFVEELNILKDKFD